MADFVANVALGESLTALGQLRFTHVGPRQFSAFTYAPKDIRADEPNDADDTPA